MKLPWGGEKPSPPPPPDDGRSPVRWMVSHVYITAHTTIGDIQCGPITSATIQGPKITFEAELPTAKVDYAILSSTVRMGPLATERLMQGEDPIVVRKGGRPIITHSVQFVDLK